MEFTLSNIVSLFTVVNYTFKVTKYLLSSNESIPDEIISCVNKDDIIEDQDDINEMAIAIVDESNNNIIIHKPSNLISYKSRKKHKK